MVGIFPLTRSLLDTSAETKGVLIVDDEGCELNFLPEPLVTYSASMSVSGNIEHMFSSSLATSAILDRSSGASLQHFKAKVKNLSTHSEG